MRDDEQMEEELTVGAVAQLVGVTVRTLHHWDEIGLVQPSARAWSGYRLYDAADIARIHRVLVYREIGMPLAQIAEVLDQGTDTAHLLRQRDLLAERISSLQRMARAVELMLERSSTMTPLTPAEQAEIFGTDWSGYHKEAEQAWGETPEWAQSAARQATMSKQDWIEVRDETRALEADLVAAFDAGVQPGSPEANALAERLRESISYWFDTTHAKQVIIARGYAEGGRFFDHYEGLRQGLGPWLKAIVDANASANGTDPDSAVWE
ncbi:MAG: MerR family transcriptional regulator [Propionibacteriaceae bacterium]|nr:MerR family transcriptional regulator [Propionibacteriaceae bacterium]